MSKRIVIASENPIKIAAVETGFRKMFPDEVFTFEGVAIPSGVSDQPIGNAETLAGAYNRVASAILEKPKADYWVGIEGGIAQLKEEMNAFAWIVIQSKTQTGKARTGTFFLPSQVTALINQGHELGVADDIVFGHSNSKQKGGAIGLLTNNIIDRSSLYADAVIMALIPFYNSSLYPEIS